MNIQSGRARSASISARGDSSRVWAKMWFATKVAFFFVVAAALFNVNIYLRQKISETDRNIRRIDREIADTRRDLERLRAEYAELTSWPQIRRRIAELHLPLSAPRPGQIREIRLPEIDGDSPIAGRQRDNSGKVAAN
jgi:hypothetical protein